MITFVEAWKKTKKNPQVHEHTNDNVKHMHTL
jgi:hypothetical protein